ncbi:hypothetical protein D3C86_1395750 [compost metagenome]
MATCSQKRNAVSAASRATSVERMPLMLRSLWVALRMAKVPNSDRITIRIKVMTSTTPRSFRHEERAKKMRWP